MSFSLVPSREALVVILVMFPLHILSKRVACAFSRLDHSWELFGIAKCSQTSS